MEESNIDNTTNSNEKPNRLRQILTQIFCTKIGLLFFFIAMAVIFGILANYFEWCAYVMYACFLYPVGLTLVMIVYAWIINPIRERKETKKLKDGK